MAISATQPSMDPQGMKTRATPKQARARQRVRDILSAAVTVLETHPPGDLSATLVAARARIPVSSVYRYFPTVDTLIEELYLQAADRLRTNLERVIDGPDRWQARMDTALSVLRSFLRDHPFYRSLLVLIAAKRGAQSLHHDFNQDIVAFLGNRWARGADGFAGGPPQIVAATVVQMILALEELLMQQTDPDQEAAYFQEMHSAVQRYLGAYLSNAGEPR